MTSHHFNAAVVQVCGTTDVAKNEAIAMSLIQSAAKAGAELVTVPENYFFIGPLEEKVRHAEPVDGPRVQRMASLARELGITLLLGSIAEPSEAAERCYNTSILLGPNGETLAIYRKIHLFDIDIPNGAQFQESATVMPGVANPCVVDTPQGRIGLTICYDLRFPELYRELAAQGAQLLTVPSAFTLFTGKDHWEVLLRARAIENTCWVLASNHSGQHSPSRASYGRSMIIDPWGTVVAQCPDGPGFATARVDMSTLERVRSQLPCLHHRRM